jgi:hypothetical protein
MDCGAPARSVQLTTARLTSLAMARQAAPGDSTPESEAA